jgi:hypothetical protein
MIFWVMMLCSLVYPEDSHILSGTLVTTYKSTRLYYPEGQHRHLHRRGISNAVSCLSVYLSICLYICLFLYMLAWVSESEIYKQFLVSAFTKQYPPTVQSSHLYANHIKVHVLQTNRKININRSISPISITTTKLRFKLFVNGIQIGAFVVFGDINLHDTNITVEYYIRGWVKWKP